MTGAYFLASSIELWVGEQHMIEPDGYDLGTLPFQQIHNEGHLKLEYEH